MGTDHTVTQNYEQVPKVGGRAKPPGMLTGQSHPGKRQTRIDTSPDLVEFAGDLDPSSCFADHRQPAISQPSWWHVAGQKVPDGLLSAGSTRPPGRQAGPHPSMVPSYGL